MNILHVWSSEKLFHKVHKSFAFVCFNLLITADRSNISCSLSTFYAFVTWIPERYSNLFPTLLKSYNLNVKGVKTNLTRKLDLICTYLTCFEGRLHS